jgi:RsiW-degrading membrane proteinase PrsW (M82 family)
MELTFMENKQQPYCVIPRHNPSSNELVFFFISGIVVSIPFALFFEQLSSVVPKILSIALLAPFIEELAKIFPLFYRHGETERSIVNLGILLGLGFGISELFIYVALSGVPLIVRIPAVIFHASSAGITAYGIAKKNPLPYYLISAALHVGINFIAEVSTLDFGLLVQLVILIIAYVLVWRFHQQSSKETMVV